MAENKRKKIYLMRKTNDREKNKREKPSGNVEKETRAKVSVVHCLHFKGLPFMHKLSVCKYFVRASKWESVYICTKTVLQTIGLNCS